MSKSLTWGIHPASAAPLDVMPKLLGEVKEFSLHFSGGRCIIFWVFVKMNAKTTRGDWQYV